MTFMTVNKKIIHKTGYQVSITSWENDGDHYNTETVNFLDKNHAEIVTKFANLHRSKSHGDGGVGNMNDTAKNISLRKEAYMKFAEEIGYEKMVDFFDVIGYGTSSCRDDDFEECADMLSEYLGELGLSAENYLTRACDTVVVTFSPVEISVDVVTSEFS